MRDDEAEPDDEDDAEGDGGGGQPAGQTHAEVQAAHPVRPFPVQNKRKEKSTMRQKITQPEGKKVPRTILLSLFVKKDPRVDGRLLPYPYYLHVFATPGAHFFPHDVDRWVSLPGLETLLGQSWSVQLVFVVMQDVLEVEAMHAVGKLLPR